MTALRAVGRGSLGGRLPGIGALDVGVHAGAIRLLVHHQKRLLTGCETHSVQSVEDQEATDERLASAKGRCCCEGARGVVPFIRSGDPGAPWAPLWLQLCVVVCVEPFGAFFCVVIDLLMVRRQKLLADI